MHEFWKVPMITYKFIHVATKDSFEIVNGAWFRVELIQKNLKKKSNYQKGRIRHFCASGINVPSGIFGIQKIKCDA